MPLPQRGTAATKTKPLKHGGTEETEETKTLNHEGTKLKTKDTKERQRKSCKILRGLARI
jgi:hypothetical protein